MSNLSSVEEIDCGLHHCFAVTESGVLYAWGRNQALQLGTGKNSNQDTPTRITTQLSSGSMPCGYLTTGASAWAVGDINQLFRTSMVPPMLWGSYTKQITRAEFVTLLVGMYEQVKNTTVNESGTSKFIDLEGHPLETYVRKAVNLGLLNGTSGVYLPDLEGLYEQASSAANAGGYLAAGLPNIKGYVTNITAQVDYISGLSCGGAFSKNPNTENTSYSSTYETGYDGFIFNASNSNAIYADSINTVQPPSVRYVRAMYLGKPNAAA